MKVAHDLRFPFAFHKWVTKLFVLHKWDTTQKPRTQSSCISYARMT